jgi:carbon monoxide dehydrogenase subunit G
MEVKLDKRYPVAASPEQAWTVLRDIRATAACMPGAAITEQLDDTHFKGTVRSKVGPAVMMFGGDIELLGVDEAAKELKMLGKGADKSGSSASMNLVAHLEPGADAGSAVLVGQATILVSGKLAQFGSRLLVPVSDAMLGQFANNFNAAAMAVAAAPVGEPSPAEAAPLPAGVPAEAAEPARADAPAGAAPVQPPPAAPARAPLPAPVPQTTELNALALMWTVFKGWLAGLFGKKH